jgi:7-keto-8-aminopelargonate synthetase-like enzyme
MVDEAHATGVFGRRGAGVVEEDEVSQDIDIIMGTFGKALGGFGAYAAVSGRMKEDLINLSRGFIYSTALPPSVVGGNIAALEMIRREPQRRETLLNKARSLRDGLRRAGFRVIGDSQIIPVVLGDNNKTLEVSRALIERGYWALPIRPPTVPEGQSRLRFSVTYDHSEEMLRGLIDDMRA